MPGVKISIIGAGSAIFSLRLVGDICRTKGLSGSLVVLMDTDNNRLNAVLNLAERYAEELDSDIRFEKSADLRASIQDADFVINTALVGGHAEQAEMRKIGENHGYSRGIDSQEFNMVSDYYTLTNCGQLTYFLEVAHTMEEVCPDAYLLLSANPVFEGTNLISRESGIKVLGFCHGHHGVDTIAETLGIDMNKLDWQVAGFNHSIWLTRFYYEGKDAYALIDDWIEKNQSKWVPKDPFDDQFSHCAVDMYKFYGRMPIGDSVRNGSWKYHYDDEAKRRWLGEPYGGADSTAGWTWYTNHFLKESTDKMIRFASDSSVKLVKEFPRNEMSGEQHILFIDALINDSEKRLVLNVPNKNSIVSGIPEEVIIEVPVIVNRNGIYPEKIEPSIPDRIVKMYLYPRWLRMEWALQAYIEKDIEILEEFLVRDPRTRSYEQVQSVLQDILSANSVMKKHYC